MYVYIYRRALVDVRSNESVFSFARGNASRFDYRTKNRSYGSFGRVCSPLGEYARVNSPRRKNASTLGNTNPGEQRFVSREKLQILGAQL